MVRNEKTRQFIIEKTASIFNKKGYIGTYLSDLTQATGLTKGSIYGNFRDKNEVALEAFRFNYSYQIKLILREVRQKDKALDKVLTILNAYKKIYLKIFKNGGCTILNTAVDANHNNKALKKEVNTKIRDWSQFICSILDQGIESGELKSFNTIEYSYRMIAMIEGSLLIAQTLHEPDILLKNLAHLEKEILQFKI